MPLRWMGAAADLLTDWATVGRWIAIGGGDKRNADYPMRQVSTVYRGITAISTTLGGMRVQLDRGTPDSIVTSGPAFDLLAQPVPGMTTREWIEQIAGHLVEGGEAHIFEPDTLLDRPRQLLPVGRRQMQPVVRGETLAHWLYTPIGGGRSRVIVPEWDAYLRLFNPYDAHRGLSPLAAAAIDVQMVYSAATYNTHALRNGGAPGGLLKVPGNLTDEQRGELRKTFAARHEGESNANRMLIGEGGMEWQSVGYKNTDLELVAARKLSREEILSALGVPPVLAGIFESAHYDVADQAIFIFLLHTIAPIARKIEDLINLMVLPRVEPGVRMRIVTNDHPAMLMLLGKQIAQAKAAMDIGTPYNEATALAGLRVKPQPWGNTSLMQGGVTTVDDILAGGGEGLAKTEGDEATERPSNEEKKGTEARRHEGTERSGEQGNKGSREQEEIEIAASAASERRWEERQVRAAMPRIAGRFRAHFARQRNRMLSRLASAMRARVQGSGFSKQREVAGENERIVAKVLLDFQREAASLKLMVRDYFPRTAEASIRSRLKEYGLSAAEIEKAVKRIMDGKGIKALVRIQEGKIVGVERTTRHRVKRSLLEGLSKGETTTQLADRLREVLPHHRQVRVNAIARNEAGQAVAHANFTAKAEAGAKYKAWLTGRNPRETHVQAGKTYSPSSAIPFDDAFEIGDSRLQYPRDPRGSASEIINCNCVLVSQRKAKRRSDGATERRREESSRGRLLHKDEQ